MDNGRCNREMHKFWRSGNWSLVVTFTNTRNLEPGGLGRDQKVDKFSWGHVEFHLLMRLQ